MTRQETIDAAVKLALSIAEDDSHGYAQDKRWGPDYDCASFLITVWQDVGVPVKTEGATYTGNMLMPFIRCGFKNVADKVNLDTGSGLEKGDVLLNVGNHTEMCVGYGQVVKASINENGKISGGKPGDQTGREIYVGYYYNYPWDYVLRYEGDGVGEEDGLNEPTATVTGLPVLRKGDSGEVVRAMQFLLNGRGASCGVWGADGDFGPGTEAALLAFQRRNNLEADGICGPATWAKLLGL